MIKAILLDLDNTLLFNPDAVFVEAYIKQFEKHLNQRHGETNYRAGIHQAIKTIDNPERDISTTIYQHMMAVLAASTQLPLDTLLASAQDFYHEAFPPLKTCTKTIPQAKKLVTALLEQSYAVVIATNPLYPYEGVRRRLEWAGVSDSEFDYAFVTHAENMHFAKPNPAYYAEIIARVGVEPDEALMIGNNPNHDIHPAKQVGLHTLHLHPDATPEDLEHGLSEISSIFDETNWDESWLAEDHHSTMIEPQYRGNLGALMSLVNAVPEHFWDQHPDPEEWSPRQVVYHLLESERTVQRPRMEHIINEDNPFLVSPNPPPGPRELRCQKSGMEMAQAFIKEREQTITLLRTLSPSDWQRPARHSIFGPTTLLEMAYFTAQHDRLHINQLCQTLGNCN